MHWQSAYDIMPVGKVKKRIHVVQLKRKTQCGNTGVLYSHFSEGLSRRLVTGYSSLSSHLMM